MKIDMRVSDDVVIGLSSQAYLDGNLVEHVLAANEDRGVLLEIRTDQSGYPMKDENGNYLTRQRFGDVEIRLKGDACDMARESYDLRREDEDVSIKRRPNEVFPMGAGDEVSVLARDPILRRTILDNLRGSRQARRLRDRREIRDRRERSMGQV